MHLRQKHFVENLGRRGLHAFAIALLDFGRAAADQDEILARLHRAGVQQLDGRALDHLVRGKHARGDAAELDQCDGGELRHTIRKWSNMTQRRSRENVRASVMPSPVGEAIVNDVLPSPPFAQAGVARGVLHEDAAVDQRGPSATDW